MTEDGLCIDFAEDILRICTNLSEEVYYLFEEHFRETGDKDKIFKVLYKLKTLGQENNAERATLFLAKSNP